jgi:hypothetical protein
MFTEGQVTLLRVQDTATDCTSQRHTPTKEVATLPPFDVIPLLYRFWCTEWKFDQQTGRGVKEEKDERAGKPDRYEGGSSPPLPPHTLTSPLSPLSSPLRSLYL